MMGPPPLVVTGPREIHCPFCGWNRVRQTTRNSEDWNLQEVLRELGEHMGSAHSDETIELLRTLA
jgi:hypothetical protein